MNNSVPVAIRLWRRVNKNGAIPTHRPDLGPCWPWEGYREHGGYGVIRGECGMKKAHRVAWESVNGPIPDGKELDHICHDPISCTLGDRCPHRGCCNPAHLEAVTKQINYSAARSGAGAIIGTAARAITHCPHGHEYSSTNTYRWNNKRGCRTCRAVVGRKYREGKSLVH